MYGALSPAENPEEDGKGTFDILITSNASSAKVFCSSHKSIDRIPRFHIIVAKVVKISRLHAVTRYPTDCFY